MCQVLVKIDNFEFFGINLGKLPNYGRYFGSNNVESWVEAEMSWLEVDGAGWSWVHDLVIINKKETRTSLSITSI